MDVTRLIYFSENQLDPTRGSVVAQLSGILSASNRHNAVLGITGALIFDRQWFLQALEGEREKVWRTLKRIEEDDRHSNVVVVEAGLVPTRLFANWWMGLAYRDAETEHEFAAFDRNGRFDPRHMTAATIVDLMVRLSKLSMSRKLAKQVA